MQDDVYSFEETNFQHRPLWTTDLEGKTKKITDGAWTVGSYDLNWHAAGADQGKISGKYSFTVR